MIDQDRQNERERQTKTEQGNRGRQRVRLRETGQDRAREREKEQGESHRQRQTDREREMTPTGLAREKDSMKMAPTGKNRKKNKELASTGFSKTEGEHENGAHQPPFPESTPAGPCCSVQRFNYPLSLFHTKSGHFSNSSFCAVPWGEQGYT